MIKISIIYCCVENFDGVKSSQIKGPNCWDEKQLEKEESLVVSLFCVVEKEDERDKVVCKDVTSLDCDAKVSSLVRSNEVNDLHDDELRREEDMAVSLINSLSLDLSYL